MKVLFLPEVVDQFLELANKIGADKSYVSRVERGEIMPSVGAFYRIIAALGFRVQLTNQ